ncbi:MAG: ATP-binding protein [Muribaculaceae bacterium]|nr:ATP-binding protein [Muribaculaceae bacterium]
MMQLLDILEYGIRGGLFLYLCEDAVVLKKKYAKQGKYLFFLLFVIGEFWLSHSKWLSLVLYGDDFAPQRSSTSIFKLLLLMGWYFLLLHLFYEGSRLLQSYLVLLFVTLMELARFGVHGFWSMGLGAYVDWLTGRVIEERISLEHFESFLRSMEYVWVFSLTLFYTGIVWLMIRRIRKCWRTIGDIGREGISFLMLSPAVGIAFDLFLRCLFFTRTGQQIDYIYDRHRGMYALIPAMSLLCLLSILYSVKIYEELMRAQEEKNSLLFYKQQLSDMAGHVVDMERLYDSIRGMRHDLNNSIADMEQLFRISTRQGTLNGAVEAEAKDYLHHMKEALEELTMRYSTGNPVMDVIINRKWQECEKAGIGFTSDFLYPEGMGVEAFDLGILMNNALDNAIEACKKCKETRDAKIRVHSYRKQGMFFIQIENDCNSDMILYTEGEGLKTTKEDSWMHGIGLNNMKNVVERYFGTMRYGVKEDTFYVLIMLQGTETTDNS